MNDDRRADTRPWQDEAIYRFLYEEGLTANAIVAPDFTLIDVNERFAASMGYTKEELIGKNALDFIRPDQHQAVRESLERNLRGEPGAELEVDVLGRGTVRTLLFAPGLVPIHRAGQLVGVMASGIDITARKQAQDALRKSEAWHRSLMDNAASVHVILNAAGEITYVSPSVRRVYGWEPEELEGTSILELIHPNDARRATDGLDDLLAHPGAVRTAEHRYRHKDGSWRTVNVSAVNLLADPAVGGVVVSSHDITERRQAERGLREAHRKLITAREVERRRLAGELHDSLGQQLVAMRLAVEEAAAACEAGRKEATAAALASAAETCSEMIREVRGMCHGLFPPALESLGLVAAVEQLVRRLRGPMRLEVRSSKSIQRARFDPAVEIAVFRIVQEAVHNALRHSRGRSANVELAYDGGCIVATVTDDGAGFDVVQALDEGLGLTTMSHRAWAAGGGIDIASEPGKTRIQARIPCDRSAP